MDKQIDNMSKTYIDHEIKDRCGVYRIKNLINNNFYIGSTKNLLRRKIEHFNSLSSNVHWNNHLQNAYNLYSEQNFVFEVIEFCEPEERIEIEQYWLDKFYGKSCCYNISNKANKPPILDISGEKNPMYGKHHTEESLYKNKSNQPTRKDVYCLETNETYLSIAEASRRLNIPASRVSKYCNSGNKPSQEYNLCFLNHISTDNKIDKNKLDNFKLKIIELNSHLPHIFCLETNKTYSTIKEASAELFIDKDSISRCCNEKYYSAGGYHFCYTEKVSTNNKIDKDKVNIFKESIKPYKRQGNLVYCLENNKIYGSFNDASRHLNVDAKSIAKCCRGIYKQSKGYHFSFYNVDI